MSRKYSVAGWTVLFVTFAGVGLAGITGYIWPVFGSIALSTFVMARTMWRHYSSSPRAEE